MSKFYYIVVVDGEIKKIFDNLDEAEGFQDNLINDELREEADEHGDKYENISERKDIFELGVSARLNIPIYKFTEADLETEEESITLDDINGRNEINKEVEELKKWVDYGKSCNFHYEC